MSDFYSPDEICKDIDKFKNELKDMAYQITFRYGNGNVDDIVQDTYIEAINIFHNSTTQYDDLKKQVLQICSDISFGVYYKEKSNIAKPVGTFTHMNEAWTSSGDAWMWQVIEDNTGNPLKRMEALETIAEIKQYKGKWLNFDNAREYVHGFQFKGIFEWNEFCKNGKIKNVPDNPDKIYKKFVSWVDWLGIKYYEYEECAMWVHNNLSITSKEEWSNIIKELPREIPKNPEKTYKDKWQDWDVFLGCANQKKWDKLYLPYKEALEWVINNLCLYGLNETTWGDYINSNTDIPLKLPTNIPPNPNEVYKNKGWQGWFTWCGTGRINSKLYKHTYHSCMEWVKINLPLMKTKEDWLMFIDGKYSVKKPDFIPPNPDVVYRNIGWNGWNAFFRVSSFFAHIDNLFGGATIRINYHGIKLWVKPICRFKETITGKNLTLFTKIPQYSQIEFQVSDIISLQSYEGKCGLGFVKTKSILKDKYQLNV